MHKHVVGNSRKNTRIMNLKVSDVNFTTQFDWLFKLVDFEKNEYLIMNDDFYRSNHLKTPTYRIHMDSLDIGDTINCNFTSNK
jgi:hypothetical protein